MYTFETHNTDDAINAGGTCLQGYLDCPRSVLVELFGEPIVTTGKVTNEWNLDVTDAFGDSGVVAIYDWKNYNDAAFDDDYYDWNIGGNSHAAVTVIHELIAQLRTK